MDTFADFAQSQQQQQQNWIQPPPFPSPSSEHGYYYQPQDKLSLNIASLTVTSPGPPPGVLSPVTPVTPSSFHSHPFAFDPQQPAITRHYDDHHHHHHHHQHGVLAQTASYEKRAHSNRSPSSSSSHSNSQLPRKRSFTAHPGGASAPSTSSINASSGGGASQPNNHPSSSSSSSSSTPGSASLPSVPTSRPGGVGVPLPLSSVMNVNIGTPLVEVDPEEEGVYDDQDDAMDLEAGPGASLSGPNLAGGSPVEGSVCGEDFGFGSPAGASATSSAGGGGGGAGTTGMGGSMGIIGKPVSTNNFVTKLYQMISDPKSAQFITWTEHGTSFVVSNVGEFSRSILGSHFKHNNFSSFVRQLNMYGFHKINRTPRAQRTSTDAQTWEFSHNKFLRGRPDLLDEIKRKALEPDPGVKHRIELPGELASQLNMMKDDVRRCTNELVVEKRKVDRLTKALGQLWDVVGKAFPGSVPPFSLDLLDSAESPNIYITSPSASRFPPPLSMNIHSIHGLNSPTSSPTTSDFPHSHVHPHPHAHAHSHSHNHSHSHSAHHGAHPLSRQHSFHHPHSASTTTTAMSSRTDKTSTSSTPLPSSPSPGSISTTMEMDLYDNGVCDPPHVSGRGSVKRQRLDENGCCNGSQQGASGGLGLSIGVGMNGSGGSGPVEPSNMGLISSVSSPGGLVGDNGSSHGLAVPKKNSNMRARSDSAPMGYLCSSGGGGLHSQHPSSWLGMGGGGTGLNGHGVVGRPRSGSGMMPPRIAIPSINMSNMNRGGQRG